MQLNDDQIWGASSALSKTSRNTKGYVKDLRECLTIVIDPDAKPGDRHPFHGWTLVKGETKTTVEYATFEEYLAKWCQFTIEELKDLFCRDIEISNLLDIATQQNDGNPTGSNQHGTVDNVHSSKDRPDGNSKDAGLRRLRKDRPDLHRQVLDGDKSVNAAMVEAGFRKRTITVSEDVVSAASSIHRNFGPEFAQQLKEAL